LFLVGQSSFWIKTIQSFGIGWVLYPALLVVVNDTMAYVFGVLFGNHKLLPKLSPKKTVEGFVGAAFSTIAVAYPLLKFFVSFMSKRSGSGTAGDMSNCFEKFSSVLSSSVSVLEPVLEPLLDDDGTIIDTAAATTINSVTKTNTDNLCKHAIVMALYTSIISPFGGFLASAVKRAHGAKDFGSLIPGHGGVVDRFDCQVVTAPFVFLYLKSCFDS
jgi:phosphatidate cytidylyltransferase